VTTTAVKPQSNIMRPATTCTKVIDGCGGLGCVNWKLRRSSTPWRLAESLISRALTQVQALGIRGDGIVPDEIDERRVRRSCEVICAEIIDHSNLASLLLP
jgi:hypothetical protein